MTTWTTETDPTSSWGGVGTGADGYVVADYWVDGYVNGSFMWTATSSVSTVWVVE